MTNRLLLALACVLLAVRLPSLVQPMGADQGLYAYAGERILTGGLPYRDAWDQKPPAVHLSYALMRAIVPRDAAVPRASLGWSVPSAAITACSTAIEVAWAAARAGSVMSEPGSERGWSVPARVYRRSANASGTKRSGASAAAAAIGSEPARP